MWLTALALLPLALLWLYGAVRVSAPFGVLALLFHEPWHYAVAAAALAALSVLLMAIPAVDRAIGGLLIGGAEPEGGVRTRLEALLTAVGARAGLDPARYHLLVTDDDGLNAAAGGGRLLFVTRGALRLPDEQLAAILAHELGHHRDGFPVITALIWWAQLPAVPIRALARGFRLGVLRAAGWLPSPLRWLGLVAELIVLLIQLNLLWLVYLADVIVAWLGRLSEHQADRHAARWGYAEPLAAALTAMHRPGRRTRLRRLLDEHPPLASRLQRLGAQPAGR